MGKRSVVFEINLNAHRGYWLSFDEQSDDDEDEDGRTLNLDDPACWAWLADEIRRLSADPE